MLFVSVVKSLYPDPVIMLGSEFTNERCEGKIYENHRAVI